MDKDLFRKLDLLLCFDKNILKPKYNNFLVNNEVWFIDYCCYDNFFAGFWHCFLNKEITPVYLNKISKKKNNIKIINIDEGFYSTKQSSWLLNRDFIIEKSNSLIIKNLKLVGRKINRKKNFLPKVFY